MHPEVFIDWNEIMSKSCFKTLQPKRGGRRGKQKCNTIGKRLTVVAAAWERAYSYSLCGRGCWTISTPPNGNSWVRLNPHPLPFHKPLRDLQENQTGRSRNVIENIHCTEGEANVFTDRCLSLTPPAFIWNTILPFPWRYIIAEMQHPRIQMSSKEAAAKAYLEIE